MTSKSREYFTSLIVNSKNLNKKEKDILVRRLRGSTLAWIGRRYKLTAERIRQIEEGALIKLGKKISQLLLFD